MFRRLIRYLVEAVCTLAATFAVGVRVCYLAYLERGYEAIGGEYCAILMTCWATCKAIHFLFDVLEGDENEQNVSDSAL